MTVMKLSSRVLRTLIPPPETDGAIVHGRRNTTSIMSVIVMFFRCHVDESQARNLVLDLIDLFRMLKAQGKMHLEKNIGQASSIRKST